MTWENGGLGLHCRRQFPRPGRRDPCHEARNRTRFTSTCLLETARAWLVALLQGFTNGFASLRAGVLLRTSCQPTGS